jgi:hypothetical protein
LDPETRIITVLREQRDREFVPLFTASVIAYHEITNDARELRDELEIDHAAHVTALALSSVAPIYSISMAKGAAPLPSTMLALEKALVAKGALTNFCIRRGDMRAAIQKLKDAKVTLTQRYARPSALQRPGV